MKKTDRNRARLAIERLEDRRVLSTTTLSADADTYTRAGVVAGSATILDVLDNNGGAGDYVAYVRFDLSGLTLDDLQSAKLSLFKQAGTRYDIIVNDRFDVYGLTDAAGATPQNWDEATLAEGNVGAEYTNTGGDGLDASLLWNLDQESGADVYETLINANGGAQAVSGPDVVAFLQSRAGEYATFVTYVDAGAVRGWGYGSRENPDESLRPRLELGFPSDPADDPYPENPVVLPRQVEKLDRGLVALRRSTDEVYLSWRLFGDDPADIAFNVYRAGPGADVKLNATPLTQTTDFVDTTASLSDSYTYYVRPVLNGVELDPSETYLLAANSEVSQHLTIPLQIPPPTVTSDGVTHYYAANDASVGDLDGDGDYEVVLKWIGEPADRSSPSPNMYVDAYDLDGTLLWRIDAGPNLKTIASSFQFSVYDLDGDGRAEVAMNTSDGTVSGTGQVIGDPDARWQNPDGWVTSGPEYLTVFNGLTGAVLDSVPFSPARGESTDWGDDYGHRATTLNQVVAYLDGQRPSLVTGRGLYHGIGGIPQSKVGVTAWDYRDGQLTERWAFVGTEGTGDDQNSEYVGQGNHQASVADVDGDGFDEIIWGSMVVDHNGAGLYSTGRGHGDALHVADMDPDNPGLEIFSPHESPGEYRNAGGDYRDAMTGELLIAIPATNDVGRGVAFDIDPNYPGYEFWATTNDPDGGQRMIFNVQEGAIYDTPSNMSYNFGVWWDADSLRELLDGTTISKWRHDWSSPGRQNLVSFGNSGINSTAGLSSNNGTKSTPALAGDLFGDWREEVIWRRSDNSALEIWSTTISATSRIPTLMHDVQYRTAIAWQNGYYNQPPHPSYFLGAGMDDPPTPPLFYGGELEGDYNRDGVVNTADYTVWRDTLGRTTALAADGDHNGVVEEADRLVWANNFGAVAAAAVSYVTTPSAQLAMLAASDGEAAEPPVAAETSLPLSSTLQVESPSRRSAPVRSRLTLPETGLRDDAMLLYLQESAGANSEQVGTVPFNIAIEASTRIDGDTALTRHPFAKRITRAF